MPSKKVKSKVNKKVVASTKDSSGFSWIWYVLGVLILLAILFFTYKGMTGNAVAPITGNAASTSDAFQPIIDMVSGLIKGIYKAIPFKSLVGDLKPVAGLDESGMYMAKLLLMILVFAMVSAILKVTGVDFLKEGWSHWLTSFIVAVLSVRFLNAELVATILIPYSTFGVVLTAVLPLVLYFFFVEKSLGAPKAPFIRKTAWIFFAVVFLAIWIMRKDSLPTGIVAVIYPLTALLALVMAFADGIIQKWWVGARMERKKATLKGSAYVALNDKADECNQHWVAAINGSGAGTYVGRIYGGGMGKTGKDAYDRDIAEIQKQMRNL